MDVETSGETSYTSISPPNENTRLLDTSSGQNHIALTVASETRAVTEKGAFARWLARQKGSRFLSLMPSILLGLGIWYGLEPAEGLTPTSVHLLAVFVSVIFALLTTNCEMSLIAAFALAVLSFTRSFECETKDGLSVECSRCGSLKPGRSEKYQCDGYKGAFEQALVGYSNDVNWLIFCAFHLGHAVEITLLGKRLSLVLVKYMGSSVLGLGYAITISELILGPFVPSNTARGGGIVRPIVSAVASSLGSTPGHNHAAGGFLMLVGAQANLISASFYLTGMAANPLVVDKTRDVFPGLKIDFMTWTSGSLVPGLTALIIMPWLLKRMCFTVSDMMECEAATRRARLLAEGQLDCLGPMSDKEKQLCFTLIMCLGLWVTDPYTGLDATAIAFCAITLLLLMETISWKDISQNTKAWDTFFWLGAFITIAQQLTAIGISAYLGRLISHAIQHVSTSPLVICVLLSLAYFLSTFLFSSLTAHTIAFAAPFLEAGKALGVPGMLLFGLLGYFSSLGGCMTNFSTGTVVMYFAEGYVSRARWFAVGFVMAAVYITIFLSIGMLWWKLLGWY